MKFSSAHWLLSSLALAAFTQVAAAQSPLPTSVAASSFFFTVHSSESSAIWVAPPTWRVERDTPAPSVAGAVADLHAARNEFEPVQVVTRTTATGTRSLSLAGAWSGPSDDVLFTTLHDVAYGGAPCAMGLPDRLNPIAFGSDQPICPGSNQAFWLTVLVAPHAVAGSYSNILVCELAGETVTIPIQLEVFDFTLPAEIAFGSFVPWTFSGTPATDLAMRRWLYEHRLTPRQVTYPSAMSPNITWDSFANPTRCGGFYDERDQPPVYGIGALAQQFVAGVDFNDGVGFPNFIALQYVANGQPRPANFCGQSLFGDPQGADYGTPAYNAAWGAYLSALRSYCDSTTDPNNGGNPYGNYYLSKAVYFVMNEPENAADYDLAAWLAQLSRESAPGLRLMISEEAKPEIYANPSFPDQGYDIWLAHLPTYSTALGNSLTRRRYRGEQTWWYALPNDPLHFIHPNQTNRPAIETRMLTWLAWQHRVEGWVATDEDAPLGTFVGTSNASTTIRAELLREAFEDYEYFKLANGGRRPEPFVLNAADSLVAPVASFLTGYDRDPANLHWLRVQLGRQIAGQGVSTPLLPRNEPRSFGSHYLNFQDPASFPMDDPLVLDDRTWTKIGWQSYDPASAVGWFASDIGSLRYGWAASGENDLERSYVYDDYERQVTFVFGLADGVYDVEVGVGRPGGDSEPLVTVNGTNFFGDRLANLPEALFGNAVVTQRLAVVNGSLILEAGRQIGGGFTFLNFLAITGVSPASPDSLDDLWQTTHFGNATDPLAAPGADPDGDGASNLAEFHAGTDPSSDSSRPWITLRLPTEDTVHLEWSSAAGHVFSVEESSDLVSWTVTLPEVLAVDVTTAVELTRGPDAPQGYYRVTARFP